jgi:hypothetical protein
MNMSAYSIVLFLHLVGALGLFSAFALEWAGLLNLRRATTLAQARDWLRLVGSFRLVGFPSFLTLLATGLTMSLSRWGWQGWIGVALLAMVVMAVLGNVVTGGRVREIVRMQAAGEGPISPQLAEKLRDPALVVSGWTRTALGLGIVYIMENKPSVGGAFAVLGVAAVVGLLAGSAPWRRGRRLELVEPERSDA